MISILFYFLLLEICLPRWDNFLLFSIICSLSLKVEICLPRWAVVLRWQCWQVSCPAAAAAVAQFVAPSSPSTHPPFSQSHLEPIVAWMPVVHWVTKCWGAAWGGPRGPNHLRQPLRRRPPSHGRWVGDEADHGVGDVARARHFWPGGRSAVQCCWQQLTRVGECRTGQHWPGLASIPLPSTAAAPPPPPSYFHSAKKFSSCRFDRIGSFSDAPIKVDLGTNV